jgi:hypothetical protein
MKLICEQCSTSDISGFESGGHVSFSSTLCSSPLLYHLALVHQHSWPLPFHSCLNSYSFGNHIKIDDKGLEDVGQNEMA